MKIVAVCERCGREFLAISPESNWRDPYLPQKGARVAFGSVACDGRLVPTVAWRLQEVCREEGAGL